MHPGRARRERVPACDGEKHSLYLKLGLLHVAMAAV